MQLESEAWARSQRAWERVYIFCSQSAEDPLKDFKKRNGISDLHFKNITSLCGK